MNHFYMKILIIVIALEKVSSQYCYSTDPFPTRNYGEKSTYKASLNFTYQNECKLCNEKFFYILAKHGTRHHDGNGITRWHKILPSLRKTIIENQSSSKLCKEDIQHIENWQLKMTIEDKLTLAETGRKEQNFIGRRGLIFSINF